ncbi:hypothetical protein BJ138DRAFT_286368 [Hygrophoropsis aurantiaca]|uniref:Uncharacterized protein n=1 Tax=Hygrophoropsis aurantiaca TaxID=72124 RepID=A0ACB8ATF8_9AGAM|nr:hypothetical protein BJ138DRAFT_286368 [Hygrophoropsis aurantiaca]
MKRTAEIQLSKDHEDEDIEEVSNPGEGFRKADDTVLATRQIRGLPRRSMAGAARAPTFVPLNTVSTQEETKDTKESTAPKFGGFAGFGAPTASSSFTFTPSPSIASATTTSESFGSFGEAKNSTSTPSSSFTAPFISSTASPATKSFASLLDHKPQTPPAPASTQQESATKNNDAVALTYYKSLRGLNVSFLSAVSTAVEKDPFVDIAGLLESYKQLRTTVQSDYDNSSKSSKPPEVKSNTPSSSGSQSKPPTFAMPVAPTTFAGFSMPASTSNTSSGGGFTPSVSTNGTSSSSGFKFPSAPPASTSNSSSFAFGSNAGSTPPKPPNSEPVSTFETSVFGAAKESENTNKAPTNPPSSAFGTSSSSIPNFFATSKLASTPTADVLTKPTSGFGSTTSSTSLFGNFTTSKPSSFSHASSDIFKAAEKAETDSSSTKSGGSSLFGGNATSTSAVSAFGTSTLSDKPSNVFSGFGGGSPPKTGAFGAFGKAGGNIGNPVGFGFGVPPKSSDGESSKPTASGFSFGQPPKAAENPFAPPSNSGPFTSQSDAGENAEDDSAKLTPSNNHDAEGEGEEDEETTYEARCKVYRMAKTDGKSEWKDMGIGMLRLKKHKETSARRVLLRNSSTGKIVINFRVHAGLNPTVATKVVSFLGHDDGASTPYKLRLKSDEDAQALKAAMEGEVAAISSD